jgi:hypothetical protein
MPAMRWILRIVAVLILIWAVYFVSPYVSLYGLAKAVEAKDVAAIEQRVNFRAVRVSVAKQLIPAYLIATGRESDLKGLRGQTVGGIGASFADPLIAQYLSPEALAGFLNDPRSVAGGGTAGMALGGIGASSIGDAWRLFITAQTRGFRVISFAVPPDKPADDQFRLQMRIKGLGWRLVGIDLPKPVLKGLVQELIKNNPSAT